MMEVSLDSDTKFRALVENRPVYELEPEADITAYEVATILRGLIPLGIRWNPEFVLALPDEVRRHFSLAKEESNE